MHSNQSNIYFIRVQFVIKFDPSGPPWENNDKSKCQCLSCTILSKKEFLIIYTFYVIITNMHIFTC